MHSREWFLLARGILQHVVTIYANFHDLPRICSKKAITSTFSPPTEMWNYKGTTSLVAWV